MTLAVDVTDLRQTGGVTADEALEVIKKGHPPIAENLILIDFDGTIAPFGYLFSYPEPFEGISEFAHGMRRKGYRIGVFTSRLSPTWLESAGQQEQEHIDYIVDYCTKFDIPIDFVTSEKVPCEQYFDDKATNFHNNWKEIIRDWV